ncbi:hypothetical protein [Streptosporangium sp. NPDC002524]|uniref:hypothetical protein n=1 Tax=Streptosporangium sp. NPDC002524 TaxID=3154537 RepID=UPI00332F80AF
MDHQKIGAVCPIGPHTDDITYVRTAKAARWTAGFGRGGWRWEYHMPVTHVLICERHEVDVFVEVREAA